MERVERHCEHRGPVVAAHADGRGVHDERPRPRPRPRARPTAPPCPLRGRRRPGRVGAARATTTRAPARPSASATARAAPPRRAPRPTRRPDRGPRRAASAGSPRRRWSRRRGGRRRPATPCSRCAARPRRPTARRRPRPPPSCAASSPTARPARARASPSSAPRVAPVGDLERDVHPVEPELAVRRVVQHRRQRVAHRIADHARDARRARDRHRQNAPFCLGPARCSRSAAAASWRTRCRPSCRSRRSRGTASAAGASAALQRRGAHRRDRRRRQAGVRVRVVRRVDQLVLVGQLAVLGVATRVDQRRVDLQRHVLREPVVDHRRDQRAVGVDLRLGLDQRGDLDDVVRGVALDVGVGEPERDRLLVELRRPASTAPGSRPRPPRCCRCRATAGLRGCYVRRARTRNAPRCSASPRRTGRCAARAACRPAPRSASARSPGGIVSFGRRRCAGPAFSVFTAELTPMFLRSSYVPALKFVSPLRREYTLNTHDGPITPRCESSSPMHGTPAAVRDLHLDLAARAAGRIELPPEPHAADREHDERHDDEDRSGRSRCAGRGSRAAPSRATTGA